MLAFHLPTTVDKEPVKQTFLESINLIAYILKAKLALSLAFAITILLIKGHMNMIIVVFRNTSTIWH